MADNEVRITVTGRDAGGSAVLRDVRGEADKTGSAFAGLGKAAGIGAAAGGLAFAGLGAAVLKTGFDFNNMKQQAQIAFSTMLGDGGKAKDFLADLQQFAAKTPFEFPELVQASQKMLAMGFAAGEVKPLLTAVGDAVAGLGGSSEQVGRVTSALGQMKAKGKVSAEEMMQLTEAGIPAWDMLAKKIGTDVPGAMKLAEKGAIDADTAIAAIQEGMTSRFGGMMDAQSRTFGGVLSTLKDTFSQVSGEIAGPLFEKVTGALLRISEFVSTPEFSEGVQSFTRMLSDGFARIGELAATIGPPIIEAIGSVVNFVQSNWPAVKSALVDTWNGIAPVVQRVMDDVRAAAGHVVDFIAERWPQIEGFARQVFGKVRDAVKEIGAELGPTLEQIVGVVERVVGEIGERWGAIENVLGPVVQHAMDTVLNVIEVAKNLILLVLNVIQGDWDDAWQNIKNIAAAVWNQIQSLIDNSLKLIQGLIPLAMGLIADALSLAWEGIQKAAELAWEGIKRGAEEGLKALVRLAKSLPGEIKEAIGDLSRLLWDAGVKVLQGLIDGITSKLGALKDTLGSVTKLIPDWKGPIDKDAKLLYPAGQAVMDGLIDGITSRLPELRATLDDVTEVVRSFNAGNSPGAPGAGGAGSGAAGASSAHPSHPGEQQKGFGPGNIQGQCNYIMDVVIVDGVPTFCYELLYGGLPPWMRGMGFGHTPGMGGFSPGNPWHFGLPGFALGGKVKKTGPILAHEGEVVLNQQEAAALEDSPVGGPMSANRFLPGGAASRMSMHGVGFVPGRGRQEGNAVTVGDSGADLVAAIVAGVRAGLSGVGINLDGQTVGRLVSPYVSREIARDALLAGVNR